MSFAHTGEVGEENVFVFRDMRSRPVYHRVLSFDMRYDRLCGLHFNVVEKSPFFGNIWFEKGECTYVLNIATGLE